MLDLKSALANELIPLQLIPKEIVWAPGKRRPGTDTELPAQFWAQPLTSQGTAKRTAAGPGNSLGETAGGVCLVWRRKD